MTLEADSASREAASHEELGLWSKACHGDAEAKTALAQIVSEVVQTHSRRLRLTDADAEEVESRVRLSVWQLMLVGRSTPRTSLRGWLRFRFLAVTKEYFRERKKTQSLAPLLDDGNGVPDHRKPWTTTGEQRELSHALSLCLGELPEAQRHAVLLRYGDDQSVEQSAARLASENPNTIRVWIFRGITALRSCLEKRGVA